MVSRTEVLEFLAGLLTLLTCGLAVAALLRDIFVRSHSLGNNLRLRVSDTVCMWSKNLRTTRSSGANWQGRSDSWSRERIDWNTVCLNLPSDEGVAWHDGCDDRPDFGRRLAGGIFRIVVLCFGHFCDLNGDSWHVLAGLLVANVPRNLLLLKYFDGIGVDIYRTDSNRMLDGDISTSLIPFDSETRHLDADNQARISMIHT